MQNLLQWMRDTLTDDWEKEKLWRKAAIDQMIFFRDVIAVFFLNRDDTSADHDALTEIVGFHRSKSIDLPVYRVNRHGVELTARENFYNWNATIRADRSVEIPDYFQIDVSRQYVDCGMEGMEEWKRGTYAENKRVFSFCMWNKYDFYAVMKCIASQVVPKPKPKPT